MVKTDHESSTFTKVQEDEILETLKNSIPKNTKLFVVFTHSQETQKTIDIAVMLVPQTKEIIKILLLRVINMVTMTSGENRQ